MSRVAQGEVIQDFLDGGNYIRDRLFKSLDSTKERWDTKEEGQKAQKALEALEVSKGANHVKAEDSNQTGVSKEDARAALIEEKGDLVKALLKSVQPRPRARSVDGGAIPK
ncbi:hypothetical protein B9479_006226 [Cryptococcus floricola]|uniref:Nascent polypeptide-associated complex subunit alpha-like UBA domain-containing protein n=1 Tax=Cryptococcus floricola TaxID=2591691 RepID=A0A5D3ATR9_9TREE|nr:hypothetical protein B9479_006226 [Cryptococcus floricola]